MAKDSNDVAPLAERDRLISEDVVAYLKAHEEKSLLRFITCGSVDDGKSTLIGRLRHRLLLQRVHTADPTDARLIKFHRRGRRRGIVQVTQQLRALRFQSRLPVSQCHQSND